jgi:hypothetical protein
MRPVDRWILAITLIVIDVAIFVVPLTGLFAAYILLLRPSWFRTWIDQLYTQS